MLVAYARLLARYLWLVLGAILLNFFIPRLLPGDPLRAGSGQGLEPAAPLSGAVRDQLRSYYRLDEPLGNQLISYLGDLARGDLGWSISRPAPVAELILSRLPWTLALLLGARLLSAAIGMAIGVIAGTVTGLSTVLSWLVGLVAGFVRALEGPLLAVTDLLLALPSLPLYMLVLTLLGPSLQNLVLVLALVSWPAFARVVRSIVLTTRSASYVEASRALGASDRHLMRRHLLPATLDGLATKLVLTVRFTVFAEATLAYLGLAGSESVSWGPMLNWAFSDPLLFSRPVWPWLVLPPTLAIAALILATAWVSTGLRTDRGSNVL